MNTNNMYKIHSNSNDNELWNEIYKRRERMRLLKQRRNNVKDFMHLLSFYVSPRPSACSTVINGVYENVRNKHSFKPCGYAIRIAIDRLPINSCKK